MNASDPDHEPITAPAAPEQDTDASGSESTSSTAETETVTLDRSELQSLQDSVNDLKTRYLRAVADLENYRKRALREKEELRPLAISTVVEALLSPLDNFRLGLDAAERLETADDATGFRMVFDQILSGLASVGVEEIRPEGVDFDPNFHDGVAHQPHPEIPEGKVIVTARPGFRIGDRLIRPASVVVSSGPPATTAGTEASAPDCGENS